MGLFKSLSKMVSGEEAINDEQDLKKEPAGKAPSPSEQAAAEAPTAQPEPETPKARRVIEAPIIEEKKESADQADRQGVLIQAQPSARGDQCTFNVNQKIMDGFSWVFKSPEEASGSPMVEDLFNDCGETLESVTVVDGTVIVSRQALSDDSWQDSAQKMGTVIRKHLLSDHNAVSQDIKEKLQPVDEIQNKLEEVIETDLNPALASHGGFIRLVDIEGNTVTVEMGGGCQGCSSSAMTLREGIDKKFREAIPTMGALLDATDHSAGTNPYFS